ncbi:MAG: DUF3379 family protein [Betaproteobacteria bacterium]|nr:DUF3379 family protein [Betaproteobacteria bacterium]
MNCLEFRRHKLADPRHLPPSAAAHGAVCAPCSVFARRVDEDEARLHAALRVPVPEGLAESVLLATGSAAPRPWRVLALAATVVLSVSLGVEHWSRMPDGDPARVAIAHVLDEPESLTTTRNPDPEHFRQVLADFGGQMSVPLGQVRFVKLCPVPGGVGWHIVFETDQGLATLLLVRSRQAPDQAVQYAGDGWDALVRPGGAGYYAIVTPSERITRAVDEMIRQRVRWRT